MWFVKKGSMVSGPIPDADFKAMVAAHQISMTDLVSEDGRIWKRFGTIDFGTKAAAVRTECLPQPSGEPRFVADATETPTAPTSVAPVAPTSAAPATPAAFAPSDVIADVAGVERLKGFSLREFFSQVFKHHSDEEVEEIFSCGSGGAQRTETGWPIPWVFGRMLLLSLVVYGVFLLAISFFKNSNLFPGLIFVGSFAVPIATLILFFELNVWRDISLYDVFRKFMLGGILSLTLTSILGENAIGHVLARALGQSVAGIIEEIAKLLALVILVNTGKSRHLLGGLLLGAAVGTGFAAFESAGYALRLSIAPGCIAVAKAGLYSFRDPDWQLPNYFVMACLPKCKGIILLRGILAPFGHVVWTAIAGAALWRVKGADKVRARMFFDFRFLRLFIVPVVLHMIWDWTIFPQTPNMPEVKWKFMAELVKVCVLGVIAWAVAFSLVQEGLREAQSSRRGAMAAAPAPRQTIGSMVFAAFAFIVMTFFTGFLISAGGAFFNRVVLPAITGS